MEGTSIAATNAFSIEVLVVNGRWTYRSADGANHISTVNADSAWHQLTVSHYAARGETLFFVDGKLAGRATERLEPKRFTLGGTVAADYKDLMVFRAALNADEAAALNSGMLLQASLEVFAPLTDTVFKEGSSVENRAQSMSVVKVGNGQITHLAQ